MALLYLDTSALVKLYVQEPGSARMLELAHPDAGHRLVIVALTRIEFRAAVRRRTRLGDIEPDAADKLVEDFDEHLATIYQVQPVNDRVLGEAADVVDRHELRAYDAVQLAGCLVMRQILGADMEVKLVCSDQVLLGAASTEGLVSIDPCSSSG